MKIKEYGVSREILCPCGCLFEFDAEDIHSDAIFENSLGTSLQMINVTTYVNCPICHRQHTIYSNVKPVEWNNG